MRLHDISTKYKLYQTYIGFGSELTYYYAF